MSRSAEPDTVQEAQGRSPAATVRRMDRDGDGRISRDEFRGPPRRFDWLDSDDDGFVTDDEITALQKRSTETAPQQRGLRAGNAPAAWYRNLPVVLTHAHFNVVTERKRDAVPDWTGAEADALRLMAENNVRAAIVMPTPRPDRRRNDTFFRDLLRVAKKYPDRLRVSGGGATLNPMVNGNRPERVDESLRHAFAARAEEIVAAGAVGFGEFTALHFSAFHGHPFEETAPDHPLLLLLSDIAAKHGLPIDFHVEPVVEDMDFSQSRLPNGEGNPDRLRENVSALERLLAHNRKAKIIWVHLGVDNTGHRTVELTRRMLRAHSNLYLSITSFQTATENWFVDPAVGLNPDWRALILEFPDRFMIGSDAFFQGSRVWHKFQQRPRSATLVVRRPFLSPEVARKVAFENAQRLFGLDLIGPEDYPLPAGQPDGTVAP